MRLLVLLALVVAPLSAHPHNSSDVSSHRDESLYPTCGETINTNRTYFVNPSSPNTDTTVVNPCRTRVDLIGENVCQLRLDFQTFSLDQPADSSQCNTDSFRITGTTSASVPTICGENAGQHLYVDVDPTSRGPTLEVDTSNAGGTFPRRWAIEVTQIQCDSVERAPTGCRQLYSTTSGTVKSFNFKDPPSTAADIGTGTGLQLHLADQNYQVCIMPQSGFHSIRWQPTPPSPIAGAATSTFVMTGPFIGFGGAVGTTNAWIGAYTGAGADGVTPTTGVAPCTDYVMIPGGSYDLIAAANGAPELAAGQSDRYCGGLFPTVKSTFQPFGLHVKTDGDEPLATDTGNIGFSLDYRMLSTGC